MMLRNSFVVSAKLLARRLPFARRTVFNLKDSNEYCMNLVQKWDYENYMVGLLMPNKSRSAFFAVRAFNIEVAMIKDQIPRNTYHAGRLRIQFWKDVLNGIYFDRDSTAGFNANQANIPILKALEAAIKDNGLTLRWFERALEGRNKDISNTGLLEKMDDLEDYAEFCHSSILYLVLEILQIKHEKAEYAASHVGVCTGIVSTLRSIPFHSAKSVCYYPQEVLSKHSLTVNTVLKGPSIESDFLALKDATNDIAMQAAAHLKRVRELGEENLPSGSVFALMPALTAEHYLNLLQEHNYDPFLAASHDRKSVVGLQLRMLKAKFTNKV